jgi:hypothetical protein
MHGKILRCDGDGRGLKWKQFEMTFESSFREKLFRNLLFSNC